MSLKPTGTVTVLLAALVVPLVAVVAQQSPYYGGQQTYPQTQVPYGAGGQYSGQPAPMQQPGYYPQQQPQAQPGYYQPQGPVGAGSGGDVITVQAMRTGGNAVLGGSVVPYKEVTLAAQIPGRVEFIAGAEGDWFDEKKVLVAIDDDDLLAERRRVLAEMRTAEAALRETQVQYSRELWSPQTRSLSRAPGMGMPSMFDQFFTRPFSNAMGQSSTGLERHADLYSQGTRISQAESRLMGARSSLESIDAKLRDTRSIAPFPGVIVNKFVEVGDTVQPGQPLILFADTRYLQIRVDVPARLMPGLRIGMIVRAKLDVGDTYVDARVAQIFPMADVKRHTVTVKFDLPEGVPGGPGMYAEVMVPDVNAPQRSVPVIPTTAVRYRGSLPAVYVLNAEGRSELRLVRLGEAVDDRTLEVLSGLKQGERIFANPTPGMTSGWAPGERQSPGTR